MSKSIAIIGCGELGSRHLQGVALCNKPLKIFVVEPFKSSQERAQERYEQVAVVNHELVFLDAIEFLPQELDLVIIATTSDIRSDIVKELLKNKSVENLVLEKVLFQKIDDYETIEQLLNDKKVNCWVNHPKRMYPFYQDLKMKLEDVKFANIIVSGGEWGLGCNALHHLDIFEYLFGCNVSRLSHALNNKLYDTKRANFKELFGKVYGEISENISFQLNCNEEKTPYSITITSDKVNVTFNEVNGWSVYEEAKNKWQSNYLSQKIMYFQSELTNILIKDIFEEKCKLPTYEESKKLHIKFIELLLNHINSFSDKKYDFCPIT